MIFQIVRLTEESNSLWYINTDQAADLQIKPGNHIVIGLGSVRVAAMVQQGNHSKKDVCLSKGALKKLLLPEKLNLHLAKTEWGFKLGPVVGVMVNQANISKANTGQPVPGLCRLGLASSQEGSLLYIFHPNGLDWQNKTVQGYQYTAPGKPWRVFKFPLPDVLYDRAVFTRQEKSVGKKVRQRLRSCTDTVFLNEKHFYGKWETYQCLSQDSALKKHLPETILYNSPLDLYYMSEKYSKVFLKDDNGSRGKQIVEVQARAKGQYKFRYDEQGSVKTVFGSCMALQRLPVGEFNHRLIIQQGIELAKYRGRTFDIRVLVQKDDRGNWEVAGHAARVKAPGRVTTNISSGGKALPLPLVLLEEFPRTRLSILEKINKLVLKACLVLEGVFGKQGELGIDLALDKNGYLWLIEVNGKPAKSSLDNFADEDTILEMAYTRPLKYARFLSGFTQRS